MTEKIQRGIALLQEFEPHNGYHLAFSGGKDSICIYHLAKMAKVKFTAYMALTTIDPPEIIRFIKENYKDVKFLKPELSMFKLIVKKGILPTRLTRFCCEYLKEYAGKGEFVVLGIRWEESQKRSERKYFEFDTRKEMKGKRYLSPIIDWTELDVWEFIELNNLPYPDLYDNGYNRIGCIACPCAYTKQRKKELALYPRFKYAYLKAIKKAMKNGSFSQFKDAEQVLRWWTSDLSVKNFLEQERQIQIIFT